MAGEAKVKILSGILELLFPQRCTFCHRLTQGGAKVCPRCEASLPYTRGAARQSFPHIESCCSPLYYVDDVRRSLLRYKFEGLSVYAEVYGDFLAKCIDENKISCDSITWVSLSRKRLRRRGYDQARLLAEEVSRRIGDPCVPMLRKIRNNPAQSGVGDAKKRRENVKGVYEAIPEAEIRGKRVLLVDDIVTSGATLSACAAILRQAGAKEVSALTLARRRD